MRKKKILLFSNWYEPGYKAGGPIQSCKNIVELLKGDFDFYVFTSDRDLGETGTYPGILSDQWSPTGEELKIWYASPAFPARKNLQRLIREVAPDIVYFNSMFSYPYSLLPFRILLNIGFRGKIVLAPRGMLHQGALQQKSAKKRIFLGIFRLMGWHRKIIFHATGVQEQKDIKDNLGKNAAVLVAENIPSVDPQPWKEREKRVNQLHCVFISRIEPKKNLIFFLELLCQVKGNAAISFDIYGEEEDEAYSLKCREAVAALPSNVNVHFMGPLPHNQVFHSIRNYHLFILPTRGENFGHAIFEAMSTGCPVLISDQTPWLHLSERKLGWDLPLNDPGSFLDVLKQALGFEQEEYNQWSKNVYQFARQYVESLDARVAYLKLFS